MSGGPDILGSEHLNCKRGRGYRRRPSCCSRGLIAALDIPYLSVGVCKILSVVVRTNRSRASLQQVCCTVNVLPNEGSRIRCESSLCVVVEVANALISECIVEVRVITH